MSMAQYEPLHWDRHRSSFNFTLILSLGIAVVGVATTEPLLIVVGLAVAAFSWFTTPSQYMIYNDRLVIAYGRPRVRHVFFDQIDQVELLTIALGTRLRVSIKGGRPMFIQPRDPDEFQTRFQGALESFRREHPDGSEAQEG